MIPLIEDLPLFGAADKLETYEIHITVKGGDIDVDKFKRDCADIYVKPLVVLLRNGQIPNDVMTSCTVKCSPLRLKAVCTTQFVELMKRGWEPTRCKIECAPWHNAIAGISPAEFKPWQYFESHIPVRISHDDNRLLLDSVCSALDLHMSANAFKVDDSHRTIMTTFRSAEMNAAAFRAAVNVRVSVLSGEHPSFLGVSFEVGSPVVEFAIFDSNRSHDNAWLGI